MQKIAEVVPLFQNIPLSQSQIFSYLIPTNLESKVKIGQEVRVSLRTKIVNGVVLKISTLNRKLGFKLKNIIEIVNQTPVLTKNQIKLAYWISEYYFTSLGRVIKLFLPKKVKRVGKYKKVKYKIIGAQTLKPCLTKEQNKIFQRIINSPTGSIILLYGVTGSGKTEIYLACTEKFLNEGKQVAILVPEIALTPQIISRFYSRFPKEKIVVIHSRLSRTERFLTWQKIYQNIAKIIIGPRSIIFAPYQNLGLVVIDEEHDSSYKSYDQSPKYNARDTGIVLAKQFKAKVILGSATPSLESYYQAEQNKYILCKLLSRYYRGEEKPYVEIVDMKEEIKKKNFSVFSEKLKSELRNIYEKNRQALLFLNRRGTATFVLCQDCSYVAKCKQCDVSLVCHTKAIINKKIYQQKLICHHCGKSEYFPLICPYCGGSRIKLIGFGTEKVEREIKEFLPKAKTRRLDTDTVSKKFIHHKLYYDFLQGKYHFLVGTQMIAKGWDIPGVDLVGIISADSILNLPDYKSSERTFQLILQTIGRTGRKDNPGKVVLQTYQPDNPVILTAAKHNFEAFYKQEIEKRKELDYPPFSQLIKITFRHKNKNKAREKIFKLADKIQSQIKNHKLQITQLGPAPAFIPKIRNYYIWQIILKSKIFDIKLRNKILQIIPPGFIVDIDPASLL